MLLLPPPEGSYNKNPPERDSRTGEGLLAPDVTLVTCVRSGIGILSLLHLPPVGFQSVERQAETQDTHEWPWGQARL